MRYSIAPLALTAVAMLPNRAQGAAVAPMPVLRPAQSAYDPNHRSFLEQAGLMGKRVFMGKRQVSETEARFAQQKCGDGSGAILNPATLVSEAVAVGLPHASNSGVVFMRVTVNEVDGCGAYSCVVSPDATGTSWTTMPILTDVPTVQAGCGLEAEPTDYSLVAQMPRDTVCTGQGGACLVMCKNEKTELGNCAAIAFSPAGAGQAAPSAPVAGASLPVGGSALSAFSSSSASTSAATTVISSLAATSVITSTRVVSATQTAVVRPSASLARVTPSTPAAAAQASSALPSSASSGKAIATIVAFSGDNGPGGLAEQQKIGTHAFAVAAGEQEDEQTSGDVRAAHPAAASLAAVILAAVYAALFA